MKKLLILLIFLSQAHYAQVQISGRVTDKNSRPLASANIYLKDTYDGASSRADGTYSFSTSEAGEQILAVSFIGYKTLEKKVIIAKDDIIMDFILEEEVKSTGTVVISAGTFEASDEKKAVILRPLDIVTTGSTADIYTALNTLPGTQQVGETEGLFVRGGSANETKTIVDEMIVQKPFYSTVPDVASRGRFSPFLFKGTVFSSGGYSAQYGQALSSALILKSQDLAPDTRSALSIMAVGLGASHVQRWENTSLSAEGGYYNMAPYYKLQKQRLDWNSPPVSGEGIVILRHKPSKTGIFKLHSTFTTGSLSLNLKNLDNLNKKDLFDMSSGNFLVNSSYSDILGKDWTFFSGLSYSRDVDNIDINSDKIKSLTELKQSKVTVSRHIFGGSFLTFGGEVHRLDFDERFNQYSRDLNELYSAGFLETDVFFTNDMAVRAGLRYEYSDLLKKSNLAPRLSLAYRLGQYDQVNLAYGEFYQDPEKDFLYSTKKLGYEKAAHYVLNYQYLGKEITFRIEGYYKDYNNLVKRNPDSLIIYDNRGKGYARGIDLFFRGQGLINNADYWVSYSYIDTKREYRDFPVQATPGFVAENTFSVVYKQYFPSLRTSAGLTYSFATGRPYFNPNNPNFMSDRTKDFQNMSLNISYLTNIFSQFTVIFLSVDNLFAYDNVYSYRYSKDGTVREPVVAPALRTLFIGMFISFGDNPGAM